MEDIKIVGYTIKSSSEEGVYYLVNGWNKNRAFWVTEKNIDKAIFKTIGRAKTSLTKLLKIIDDYKTDTFELVAITENGGVTCL